MSYQIQYHPEFQKQYPTTSMRPKRKRKGFGFLLAIGFLLLCFFVREKLYMFLIPGEPAVTVGAFSQMVNRIQQGIPVGESVMGFCEEIISHGF